MINLEVIHLKMITESPCTNELNKEMIIGRKKCLQFPVSKRIIVRKYNRKNNKKNERYYPNVKK